MEEVWECMHYHSSKKRWVSDNAPWTNRLYKPSASYYESQKQLEELGFSVHNEWMYAGSHKALFKGISMPGKDILGCGKECPMSPMPVHNLDTMFIHKSPH